MRQSNTIITDIDINAARTTCKIKSINPYIFCRGFRRLLKLKGNEMGKFIDLTGQKFDKLTVIKRAEDYVMPNGRRKIMWLCKCECGNDNVIVRGEDLRSEHTKTCGCSWGQHHGKSHEKIYKVWKSMKERCGNPNSKSYKIYGAEGKKVCDEWIHDFQAFYDWSMANGYNENLTIERIDGTKGYSPDNCTWATRTEQMNNVRDNKYLTYNGKTQTRAQWAREMNINYHTLVCRLDELNWGIEKALTTPAKQKIKREA